MNPRHAGRGSRTELPELGSGIPLPFAILRESKNKVLLGNFVGTPLDVRARASGAPRCPGQCEVAAVDRAASGSTHPSVFNEARRAARPVRRSAHFVSIRVADAGRGRPRAAAAPAAQQCGHRRPAWSQGSARRLWIRRISRATLGGPRDLVAHLGGAAARRRRGPTRAGFRIGRLIIAWLSAIWG